MNAKKLKPHIKYSSERKQYSISVNGRHIGWGRTLESMWRAHSGSIAWRIWELEEREKQARRAAEDQAREKAQLEMKARLKREKEERQRQNLEEARRMFRDGVYLYGPETLGLLPLA